MTDLATQIEQAGPAEQWAMLVAALEPFVREFDRRRDSYIKRYPSNPGIGAQNFDAMPDDWIMEDMPLTMGDFRRAALALAKH